MLKYSSNLESEEKNSQRTEPAEQTSKIEYDALNLTKKSIEKVRNIRGSLKIPRATQKQHKEIVGFEKVEENVAPAAVKRESEKKERQNKKIIWFQWGSFDSYEFKP